ncbi:DNA-processing protein DprA [Hungatella hathewayi]|uniref:Uncharacterized protein n=1 Tax=Hungatella hathewayi WAL-18680 TaxID=742737 RepID=G5IFN0_9FIRM|nr:DNA-processing protein DprA [Hungatella hathewayi]EHI59688.1 hypothetical protein HMPREF9473_02308 [ [Hungatella hathewayi WAL-18680]MBS4986266.1 DNA-processing protein DprA [Hungatella hathewayi]
MMEREYTEQEYLYWLCQIPSFGTVKIHRLWEHYGSFHDIYYIEGKELEENKLVSARDAGCFDSCKTKLESAVEEYRGLASQGIRFVSVLDEEYPRRLTYISNNPMGLYVKGSLPDEERPTLAIIGARGCSNYGRQVAEYMGAALSKNGIQIVSGLAAGIDGYGHRGAIREGQPTYGVLGCGVNICYPRENYPLYESMMTCGGVLSECRLSEAPAPKNFPMRNRIISGLSDAVLVVEAREKSGSLITVEYALEQGKEVFAIPGPITEGLSRGCNRLIKAGAGLVSTPEDILDFFDVRNRKMLTVHEKSTKSLAKNEKMLYSCLDLKPKFIEEIAAMSGLSIGACAAILLELELEGFVVQPASHYYARVI